MAVELAKDPNAGLDLEEYETLLRLRDKRLKEADGRRIEYVRLFGELTLRLFRTKVECIRAKKALEFRQRYANRGREVDPKKLQAYLEREMAAFEAGIEEIREQNRAARETRLLGAAEAAEIKAIHRSLVKRLHPDVNPLFRRSKRLRELWERICAAHRLNDLRGMRELAVLVEKALEGRGSAAEFEIPDLRRRIAEVRKEIETVVSTEPYTFRSLLSSPAAIRKKRAELRVEIKAWESHLEQLRGLWNSNGAEQRSDGKWLVN